MQLEYIRETLKNLLKASRYRHSLGVEEVSCDLALIYGYDTEKASIAGLLHDCARCLTEEELVTECINFRLPISDVEFQNSFLLHAKVGAVYAKLKYGVEDEEIINAIKYHTTGRPAMSLLEKIIFTADYIEPYRKQLPRINEIRMAAYEDLDFAVFMILENTLEHLKYSGDVIDNLTNETYVYYEEYLRNINKIINYK